MEFKNRITSTEELPLDEFIVDFCIFILRCESFFAWSREDRRWCRLLLQLLLNLLLPWCIHLISLSTRSTGWLLWRFLKNLACGNTFVHHDFVFEIKQRFADWVCSGWNKPVWVFGRCFELWWWRTARSRKLSTSEGSVYHVDSSNTLFVGAVIDVGGRKPHRRAIKNIVMPSRRLYGRGKIHFSDLSFLFFDLIFFENWVRLLLLLIIFFDLIFPIRAALAWQESLLSSFWLSFKKIF